MKKLLLFCSSNYTRINNDLIINKFNLFDDVKLLTENDLDDNIKHVIDSYIKEYGLRGYGYWIWKPYIILQELNKLNDGDILVHLDVHCHLDKIVNSFDNIINKLNEQSIIFGNSGNLSYAYTTKQLLDYVEKKLNYKFENLDCFCVEAGIIFIKKNKFSINFIKKWLNLMLNANDIITDKYNEVNKKENKLFIDYRHDQSLVNLLHIYYKLNFIDELSWETLHVY